MGGESLEQSLSVCWTATEQLIVVGNVQQNNVEPATGWLPLTKVPTAVIGTAVLCQASTNVYKRRFECLK